MEADRNAGASSVLDLDSWPYSQVQPISHYLMGLECILNATLTWPVGHTDGNKSDRLA